MSYYCQDIKIKILRKITEAHLLTGIDFNSNMDK